MHQGLLALTTMVFIVPVGVLSGAEEVAVKRHLVVMGSSVAKGGEGGEKAYARQLEAFLRGANWTFNNISHGGYNTNKTRENLLPQVLKTDAGIVFIGLSLANEGLRKDKSEADAIKTGERFLAGINALVDQLRKSGRKPVIGLCYPHGDYQKDLHYPVLKQINLRLQQMNVPSANFLGATDDGAGRWVSGLDHDPGHPNAAGHDEMFMTIVPSLFQAIAMGKKPPSWVVNEDGLALGENQQVLCRLDSPCHSITVTFSVHGPGVGPLLEIDTDKGPVRIVAESGAIYYQPTTVHEQKRATSTVTSYGALT